MHGYHKQFYGIFVQTLRCEIFEMMREYVGAKHNKA